jgi:UDP-N-acetylglucosamine transferase subunit ALG13
VPFPSTTQADAEPTTLLVASTGGHLRQLHQLQPRLRGVPARRLWVTFDTPQSRSLLEGEEVRFARFTAPRDYKSVMVNLGVARRTLRLPGVQALVSTGSGLALPFFAQAGLHGVSSHYIESAARIEGPSLTGKLVSKMPEVKLYTQHQRWASEKWRHAGAVLDDFVVQPRSDDTRGLRILVTLGTIPYGFPRLVGRLLEILPPDARIVWQLGQTHWGPLPGEVRESMTHAEMVQEIERSDVVVAHAGVGTALDALDAGRLPILVPRLAAHDEHIDDHQRQIAGLLHEQGLAVAADAGELSADHVLRAAATTVARRNDRSEFELS